VTKTHIKGWDGIKKPPGVETGFSIVLPVSSSHEDGAFLERICKSGWTAIAGTAVAKALSIVQEMPILSRVFGYASVAFLAVEMAAETLEDHNLLVALPRLCTPPRTKMFSLLPEGCGSVLVEAIVDTYKKFSLWPYPPVLTNSRSRW